MYGFNLNKTDLSVYTLNSVINFLLIQNNKNVDNIVSGDMLGVSFDECVYKN